jgi:anti-sigma factor RsiW
MISPIGHRRMRHSVQAYLDGELHGEEAVEVARHLSTCWGCNTLAETLRLIKQSLRQRRGRTAPSLGERRLRHFPENLAAGLATRYRPARRGGENPPPSTPDGVVG